MDIQKLFSLRIGGTKFGTSTEIYKFEKIKRAKAEAKANKPETEILDFGVGEPDQIAPAPIREAMKTAIDDAANRGYADNGIPEFKKASAEYLSKFFGVTGINPDTDIVHSIGSKPALAMMPLCFINPGDVTIATVPGYPVIATHTKYLGGEVHKAPLLQENGFYPDLNAIPEEVLSRARLFYVNYPNNPTGAPATAEFFDRLIDLCDKHNILIVQDAAYATLVYDQEPVSILSRPGGKETALELHSMSKSYNMTGWRLGFVAGCTKAVSAYAEVKDNIDSGQFKAIQKAACAGIADKTLADSIKSHYEKRLRRMVEALASAGFKASMPGGTFYLYTEAPKSAGDKTFASAEDASQHLIKEHSVSTVPWDDAGRFLRFSATFESAGPDDDERVLSELKTRLSKAQLAW